MSSGISPSAAASPPVNAVARLLPLTLAVFVSFLCLGMPMPVLPLHLSQTLGLGTLLETADYLDRIVTENARCPTCRRAFSAASTRRTVT